LPLGLKGFYYSHTLFTLVDDVKYSRIKFTLEGYQSIKRIQKRKRMRMDIIVTITDSLHDWIWKPMCSDGSIGVRPRLDTAFLKLH
jgi:hypothetical protein